MNITTATNTFNTARAAAASGEHLKASDLFITAMRMASQCRSTKRDDIFFHAHVGSVMQAEKVLETSADQRERSEAGRIKAESNTRFHKGL